MSFRDCRNCRMLERKMARDLEAAKLREAELTQERNAALSALENIASYDEEDGNSAVIRAKRALSESPSAVLAERDRAQQLKGWQDCLDSVRGSLRGYPDCGGDIEVMREVERIKKQEPTT